jgi:hypothetical protein
MNEKIQTVHILKNYMTQLQKDIFETNLIYQKIGQILDEQILQMFEKMQK